jgi:hypothetical protein
MATIKQKIALVFISTAISIIMVFVVAQYIVINNQSLNEKIILNLWQLKINIFGYPKIGIFQTDPQFGFRHKPSATGRHKIPYHFNATYTTDKYGNRKTPGDHSLPKILLLGCSFTFGHGVNDEDAYPAILSRKFPDFKIINGGCMAWGTIQAWLKLKEELSRNDSIIIVTYGIISHHLKRNYLDNEWLLQLSNWDKKSPHYEFENGKIIFCGLAGPTTHQKVRDISLIDTEIKLTKAIISDMDSLCKSRQIPFVLVHLPDNRSGSLENLLGHEITKHDYHDLNLVIDFKTINNNVDGHPTKEGYTLIANEFEKIIVKTLNQVKTN